MRDSLPRGFLFDFDGVIVHTEPLHYQAFMAALAPLGVRLTWEEYIRDYLGYADLGAVPVALATVGKQAPLEEVRRLVEVKNAAYEKLLYAQDPIVPESKAFIRRVSAARPCVVVSMARRAHIEMVLKRGGLAECFGGIVSAEEVTAPKPDPQGYRKGLEVLKKHRPDLAAGECLVVEDSVPGIQAGQAAGCRVLAVASTHGAETLTQAHAVAKDLGHATEAFLAGIFAKR